MCQGQSKPQEEDMCQGQRRSQEEDMCQGLATFATDVIRASSRGLSSLSEDRCAKDVM